MKEWQNPLLVMGGEMPVEELKIYLVQNWDSFYYRRQCWGLFAVRKKLLSNSLVFTLLTWINDRINRKDLDKVEGYGKSIWVHIVCRYCEAQWKSKYSVINEDDRGRWIGYLKMELANMYLIHMPLEIEETIYEWSIRKKLKGLYSKGLRNLSWSLNQGGDACI